MANRSAGILTTISKWDEEDLLRILRPQFETSVYSADREKLIEVRSRLDRAFRKITKWEIADQLHLSSPGWKLLTAEKNALAELSRNSHAFLRYTNANLFFGVRFFAGRVDPPEWFKTEIGTGGDNRDNKRTFPLLSPPCCKWPETIESACRFLHPKRSLEAREALGFLDGAVYPEHNATKRGTSLEEPGRFELWLRGLRPEASDDEAGRFEQVAKGITEWALERSGSYLALGSPYPPDLSPEKHLRPAGGWSVTSPFAARFGLADLYWITAILRADVTADAAIIYGPSSWLHLLRIRASLRKDAQTQNNLLKAEEVLRSVLGLTSELVQNAAEITFEKERRSFEPELHHQMPVGNATWRQTFDEELEQIAGQRQIRRFGSFQADGAHKCPLTPQQHSSLSDWSEKLKTGVAPQHLIGLALSGGGIRSATFSLGVLQGLQELDHLRSVDYLSTVSGGGFIGAWLLANVSRTKHWLGRLASWDESVSYLRRYSSYLSPITGILSTDWWTMWAIYVRNTFLIQVTGLAWLLTLLVMALLFKCLFVAIGGMKEIFKIQLPNFYSIKMLPVVLTGPGLLAGLMSLLVNGTLLFNFIAARRTPEQWESAAHSKWLSFLPLAIRKLFLRRCGWPSKYIQYFAVLPSWIGSFVIAGLIWGDATARTPLASTFTGLDSYKAILISGWGPWLAILVPLFIGLAIVCWVVLNFRSWRKVAASIGFSLLSTVAFYLQLCGIMRLFLMWTPHKEQYDWYAFVLGPSLILAAFTVTIVLLIGLSGRYSKDGIREWWTRFGALLLMVAVLYLTVSASAVFGPLWILGLAHSAHPAVSWGALASAVTTIGGGLFAGQSSRTDGQATQTKARMLELLARIGGVVFILTAILSASTLLFLVLQLVATDENVLNCSWSFADCYWKVLNFISVGALGLTLALTALCAFLFSKFFDINVFGLSQFYTNRLVRCYLGATRWIPGLRRPQAFTAFDSGDDLLLHDLKTTIPPPPKTSLSKNRNDQFRGPFPIVNCSLNLGGSSDLTIHTRHSASFFLTPTRCGSDRPNIGFANTAGFAGSVTLGQATAVSGAAVSPNMGYNTSPVVAFLLTMFNVRLGWWFANPGRKAWASSGLTHSFRYLFLELIGIADENRDYVNVSDGGHFENLGIYELVRRRCRLIIAVDAECDEFYTFGSLGNLVRICETDFGAKIDIDISSIRPCENGFSKSHAAVGTIYYSNGTKGYLLYLKSSVTGDEDVGVAQYRSTHPTFPHESTAEQFFSENQFESYRRLGHHAVLRSFRGAQIGESPVQAVERLASLLTPEGPATAAFLQHTKALDTLWERFRQASGLRNFWDELAGRSSRAAGHSISHEEVCAANELLQFMENVFLDLRLDDFWTHPDNRGWALLFANWARSITLRQVWEQSRSTYGIRFEYFCSARLGLRRDEQTVRV